MDIILWLIRLGGLSRFANATVQSLSIAGLGLALIENINFPKELYGLDISSNPIETINELIEQAEISRCWSS
ncbi:hypothetical protein [Alishewanella longhuensis]